MKPLLDHGGVECNSSGQPAFPSNHGAPRALSFCLLVLIVFCVIPLVSSASAQYPGAQPVPDDLKIGFDAIKTNDAKRVLTYLATKCEGRGTGQKGFEKAAKFVASEFKHIGLKPLGNQGSYFQRAEVSAGSDVRIKFRGPGGTIKLGPTNYQFTRTGDYPFKGPVSVSGLPAFVEYAGKPAKLADPASLKQKVVFLHLRGDFFSDDAERDNAIEFLEALNKTEPLGVMPLIDQFKDAQNSVLTKGGSFWGPQWYLSDDSTPAPDNSCGLISIEAQPELLQAASIPKLTIPAQGSAVVTFGNEPITLKMTGHIQKVTTENVVGLLQGSDPALKSEYIVVGAHLDHFGIQDGKTYQGADDDGSGSCGVVEVARAMMANPKRPRRSIIFVTFFGEEQRLLGSRYFVAHPPVPLTNIVAMFQLDDVGRDAEGSQQQDKPTMDHAEENRDTVRLIGSKRVSTDLDEVVRKMNAFVGLRLLDDGEYVFHRSDQANFAKKGIPVCWWFTGYNLDWHQPTDTVEKIDWLKLTSIAKHVYLSAQALADADSAPAHNVGKADE